MREWDDVGRQMGAAGPTSQPEQDAGPGEERRQSSPGGARGPQSAPESPLDWEDDFEPRYCVRCHKRIPVIVSERQDACDECLGYLEDLAHGAMPGAMPPGPGETPACPQCGATTVTREWRTDWISRAVDVATELVGFFFLHDRYGNPIDTGADVGPAKVIVYRCLACNERWRPRL